MANQELSYYDLLQVSPHACKEVIEAAYRALQKQMHPDQGGDTELAQVINRAKEVLTDPTERTRYNTRIRIGTANKELSYYDLLQVSPHACVEVIEAAYRALEKLPHDDGELKKARNRAHEVLPNPTERNRYDTRLRIGTAEKYKARETVIERTYVFCLNCRAKNRVANDCLETGKCGQCGTPFIKPEYVTSNYCEAGSNQPKDFTENGIFRVFGFISIAALVVATLTQCGVSSP
ncbi:DnaJ-like protein [compost metagenome]